MVAKHPPDAIINAGHLCRLRHVLRLGGRDLAGAQCDDSASADNTLVGLSPLLMLLVSFLLLPADLLSKVHRKAGRAGRRDSLGALQSAAVMIAALWRRAARKGWFMTSSGLFQHSGLAGPASQRTREDAAPDGRALPIRTALTTPTSSHVRAP